MNFKFFILFFSSITLLACGHNVVKPEIVVDNTNTCIEPPKANAVIMREVNPTVIRDENGIYWIGLLPKDYENLAQNMSDLLAHLRQKNAIIKYYRQCIEETK